MDVLKTEEQFKNAMKGKSSALSVVHFLAEWAPQCAQVTEVLKELKNDKECSKVQFLQIEAEDVPEISMAYEIQAVPTVIFLSQGKAVDRVDGVKIAELTQKVRQYAQKASNAVPIKKTVSKEDLNTRLKKLINMHPVMLFMKGDPDGPRCGFSRTIVGLLKEKNVKFGTFDILSDNDVRQGLKTYSDWQLYPQIYVNGTLIGGLDIVKELIDNDEFYDTFPKQEPLEDRLKALINCSKVILFMKGDRGQPKCGFSRQVTDLLNSTGVEYDTFDILEDDEVRQGLKEFSQWMTYPQLYVGGELIGGLDILQELESGGELVDTLKG